MIRNLKSEIRKILASVLLLSYLFFSIITTTPAHASCFNPAGNAGDMRYNGGLRTMQYCNGGAWISTGPPMNTASGLVGWWKLDETSGTSAADSSGNGYTGTLQAAASWTTGGMNGGALAFNGTTQYVTTGTLSGITNTATLSFWIKTTMATEAIFSGIGGSLNCAVNSQAGKVSCTPDNGNNAIYSTTIVNDGAWHYVAFVVNNTTQYLYVDGALQGTQTATPSLSGAVFIGGSCCSLYLAGTLDDVRVYSRALSASDIKTLYTSTGGASGDINSNLVGYWKFDEASGTVAADSSGNANTGTTYNTPTWGAGKVNNALTFNGTNQYVDAGNGASLNLGSTGTVAMWLNTPVTDNGPQVFLTKGLAGGDLNGYMMYLAGGGSGFPNHIRAELANGSTSESIFSALTMNDGNWHHYVFTWDGSFLHLYVDGAENATPVAQTLNPVSNVYNLEFGRDVGSSSYYWPGTMDDVRVYNRDLSPSDVLTLYNSTLTACASPVGYTGDMLYNNGTYHVPQYCDGSLWQPMGKVSGTGGAGCSSPAGSEGNMIYNKDYSVMQYCDGTTWRQMPNRPITPTAGLAGWWKLDDGVGTSAVDFSGNGNTGTLFNTPTWTAAGNFNGALTFNGTNQYMQTPSVNLNTKTVTVSMWVNRTYLAGSGHVGPLIEFSDNYNNYNDSFAFLADDYSDCGSVSKAFDIGISSSSGTNAKCYAAPTSGVWHLLTVVYDTSQPSAGEISFYIDGVLQTLLSQPYSNDNTNTFGNHPFYMFERGGSTLPIAGTVDDVRVYSRALTPAEILQLYNGT